jgi:hypothetical protein
MAIAQEHAMIGGMPIRVTAVGDDTYTLDVSLGGGDIEIGAVEIKDATTNTRAQVSADGLEVDVSDRIDRLLGRTTNYDVLANGTLGALNATVSMPGAGLSTIGLGISGTWVGTIVAEIDVGDGVWDVIPLVDNTMGSAALSTTANGNFLLGVAGALTIRVRMSLYTSGTATVYMEGTSATAGVFLSRSIPTGTNNIGNVDIASALPAGTNNIGDVDEAAIDCSTADIHVPAVNTAAVVTYGATPGLRHCLTGVGYSYSNGIPTGGRLTITDAGNTVFDIDIVEEGAGAILFPKPKRCTSGSAAVVTLAAGGAGIQGKVNVINHWYE